MSTYTPDQLMTASQAARLLSVHISTIRRWIKQGKLPAYRVGDKGVRVRHADVVRLITPFVQQPQTIVIPPITKEEQERGLRALDEVERLNEELLAKRGGKLFPDSTELIRQQREERTRELMRALEE